MPTSAPGSKHLSRTCTRRGAARGFTVIELLLVIAIMAVAVALVSWALPDGDAARLEEESARLSALLEMARAEARVSGTAVRWVPRSDADPGTLANGEIVNFRFVGLPPSLKMPTRWLDARVRAQVVGATTVLLGPEAILPPQRIVLSLGDKRVELASDGLGPFAEPDAAAPDRAEPDRANATAAPATGR
jgi:general secretion pathway protein H